MKYCIFFLFFNLFSFCQTNYEPTGAEKIHFINSQLEAELLAKEDISKQNIYIFIQADFAPIIYSTDKYFEKNFKIKFIYQGCIKSEFVIYYNLIIFDYLDKTFDKKWKKEIRKDAIGFKNWKSKKMKTILNN